MAYEARAIEVYENQEGEPSIEFRPPDGSYYRVQTAKGVLMIEQRPVEEL